MSDARTLDELTGEALQPKPRERARIARLLDSLSEHDGVEVEAEAARREEQRERV